jgi:hypothetical protein
MPIDTNRRDFMKATALTGRKGRKPDGGGERGGGRQHIRRCA